MLAICMYIVLILFNIFHVLHKHDKCNIGAYVVNHKNDIFCRTLLIKIVWSVASFYVYHLLIFLNWNVIKHSSI